MNPIFRRIYADVPEPQRAALAAFRASTDRRAVRAGGYEWGYVALGEGPRTIVFLPGGFAPADMWLHPMLALESRCRIFSLDCSLETFRAEDCVEGALAVLDREGVDRFTLVGSSYGGGLAQHLFQAAASRVRDLVLSHCTAIDERLAGQMRRMRSVVRWLPGAAIDLQWGTAQKRAGPEGLEWSAYAAAYLREVGERVDKATLLRFLEEAAASAEGFRYDRATVDRWDGRALILSSRDDPTTFPEIEGLRTRYPAAAEHIFDHGGHATLLFRPEAYTEALAGFLFEDEA